MESCCSVRYRTGDVLVFNQPTDFEKLYAKNFEPYPNIVAPTVRNTTESEIQQAFNNYDTHNYKKAAIGFKTLYDKNKSDYANFYYAISLMADNQIEQAIEALENPNWEIPENTKSKRIGIWLWDI